MMKIMTTILAMSNFQLSKLKKILSLLSTLLLQQQMAKIRKNNIFKL